MNGTRCRVPIETTDRRHAKDKGKDKITEAKQGKLAVSHLNFARLGFDGAADRYLAEVAVQRPDSVRKSTKNPNGDPRKSWEGGPMAQLRPVFPGRRLNQITADDIRAFQAKRLGEGKHPNTINHEVRALMRVLRRGKLLSRIRDDIKLLPEKKVTRVMLTLAQKQLLFETAALKPKWQTAYCAALLTANTTMRPCEIKRAKWADLDPVERLIFVPCSKTDAGTREIPLNDEAWASIVAMKKKADSL